VSEIPTRDIELRGEVDQLADVGSCVASGQIPIVDARRSDVCGRPSLDGAYLGRA
jgi:hypothetical protein